MTEKKHKNTQLNKVFTCLGATNHALEEREENDYYASDPIAAKLLLEIEPQITNIWEPMVGEGHLAKVFNEAGKLKIVSDLIDRGYYPEGIPSKYPLNFYEFNKTWKGDIVSNPPYSCYDDETEVLTRDGWKYFKDINGTEEILSCNIETKQLEYSKIRRVIKNEVDEDLYHFQNTFIDLRVTNNHRMYCVHKEKKHIQRAGDDVITADQVCEVTSRFPRYGYSFNSDISIDHIVIPGCFVSNGQKDIWHDDIKIPIDDWLDFFGLWIADGCYRDTLNSQVNKRYTISVKQHEKTFEKAFEIVNKLPFTVKVLPNKGQNSFNIEINSKQLWLYMSQFGKSETKFIPASIKCLPAEKLKRFLDAYMFGDCGHMGNYFLLRTVSKTLAWDLHEIIVKLGSFPSISKSKYVTGRGIEREMWLISYHPIKPRVNKLIAYGKAKKEKYKGLVYCVTLEKNGFMVVRRNDKVCISGNSAQKTIEHSMDLLNDGHYLALFLKVTFLEGKARRLMFDKYPPIRVWISSSRITCAKNGDFIKYPSSAIAYGWFVWQKGYKGPTELKWFN